jgi:parallel beta-helix repeat protein
MRTIAVVVAVLSGACFGLAPAAAATAHSSTVIDVFPGPNAIANALQQANPGDTLNIHAGTYPEHFSITKTNLTLRAAGDGAVVVDGGCTNKWTVQVLADGTTVRHLQLSGGSFGEITFTSVTRGRILDSTATDTCADAEYGINVYLSGTIIMKSNVTSGFGDAGIYIGAITSTPYGPMVVQRNETFDNTRGIIIEDSAGGIIQALRNDVHDNTTTGIWLHNSDGVTVRANTVTDAAYAGIEVDPTSDNNLITLNTVSGHTYDLANEGGVGNCFMSNVYATSLGDITC